MTENMIRYERDEDGIVTLTMDDPAAGANTMNDTYIRSMGETVDRLEADKDAVAGVVLTSAKKTFFAGGNLEDLQAATPEDAAEFFAGVEAVKAQLRRLETLGRPVVAAINGSALGGGLEIALACHHRIAVDDPRIRLGLPEVTLGLLPGGGGVTRLVRLLGIQTALMDWLLQGQQRTPVEARERGIVDELVPSVEHLVPAARDWIRVHADDAEAATKPWDAKGYRIPGGTPSSPSFAATLPAFPANLRKQLKGADLPAPKAILAAAVEGAQVDFDTASRIESRYLTQLATGPVSTAMIQAFFFDLQAISSGRLRPAGIARGTVARVGIVGAGMMGAGIAHACATSGMDVVLKDVSLDNAEKGKAHTATLVGSRVARGRMGQAEADEVLARITVTADAADLAGVDVVIEAVFEDHDLKKRVFAEVEAVVGPQTLLCSNTSTLPITGLQAFSGRPADFIGLHFFSPVDKMKLVEIIRGEHTSDEATARAVDLVQQIRKIPIVVGDGRGFYTSRVFGTLVVEGAALLEEGVDPMTVERAATQAGFPAPPLAMLDEVSLTLTQHIRAEAQKAAAAQGTQLPTGPGEALIDRMVELGRPGRAGGAGFYDYPADGPKALWPGLREHFARGTQLPLRDIEDRYLFRMALETARCFEDGVLHDTPSANIGGIFGIGFPPATGGPATFMTNYDGGLAGFVSRADELADTYGERFRPTAWLRERASAGLALVDTPQSCRKDRDVTQLPPPQPYTSPWMRDDVADVAVLARTFFEREVTPHQERFAAQHQVDKETWLAAGRAGLLCVAIPEEYGGGGGTFDHEAAVLWEQGKAADDALGYSVHSSIVAPYLEAFGTEEQKRRWLPRMASGELVGAIAMTEPSAGSDLQRIRTTARRDGDHYVINGSKTFITNASHAGLVIVVARTGDAGAKGISLIVAEVEGLEGFERGRVLRKLGQHGQDTRELSFTDMRVPAENLLGGQEGQGFYQLMNQLPQERLAIAVGAVAAAERAVELAVAYTKEREAFGTPIADFQNTRFTLAEVSTDVLAARTFLDHCIGLHRAGRLDAVTASRAKYWCTDVQCEVIDRCLQLFGGYGYILEYPIARLYAAARVQKIYGGTNEIMKELIGRSL